MDFPPALPFTLVIALCIAYGALTAADSASLTAGVVMAAKPELHGATMAMHSFIGFAGGFAGPLVFGVVLDLGGGPKAENAWGAAFAVIALSTLLGPLVLRRFTRDSD